MVRSLAWATVLSTDDINVQSTMLQQAQVDSMSTECWDSIKEEWPRQLIDFHVAEISKLIPMYLMIITIIHRLIPALVMI